MKKLMLLFLLMSFSANGALAAVSAVLLAGCFFWALAAEKARG